VNSKTVFRIDKSQRKSWVIMDTRPLSDDRLSWKAKGILSYLLGKPDDWEVRIGDLIKRATDGDHAVRSAIKELIETGYITRHQERTDEGTFGPVEYIVREAPLGGFPHAVKPDAGQPDSDNRHDTNDECTNDEPTNTNGGNDTPTSLQEWLDAVRDSTNRQATLRWMVATLYPYYKERDLPDYGYIGKVAKKVGGAGYLAKLIWRCAEHSPEGNLMNYVQQVYKNGGSNGRRGKGNGSTGTGAPGARDHNTPTSEQIARDRELLEEHKRRKARA
jgi:hypothetical protein